MTNILVGYLEGMAVYVAQDYIGPKLQLSDSVPMTEAYREEINDWLLETFGIDVSPSFVKDGEVISVDPTKFDTGATPFIVMNERTWAKLKAKMRQLREWSDTPRDSARFRFVGRGVYEVMKKYGFKYGEEI